MSAVSYGQGGPRVAARHLAIIRIVGLATACGVAWGLIVSPQARRAEAHERSIAQTQERIDAGAQAAEGVPDPVVELARLTVAAKALTEYGQGTNDAQTLYNSYRRLAETCGVRVDRVEPRALDSSSRLSSVRSVVYTIDVAGSYEGVSRMIHSIQTGMGPTRVRAFRMTPAAKPGAEATGVHDWLTATIETVHVELAMPDAIREASKDASEGGAS